MATTSGKDPNRVDVTSIAYDAMAVDWELLDDLLGGTTAMRARGRTWLPQREKEKDTVYLQRLAGSYLYEAYRDTLEKLASKPFSRSIALREDGQLPDPLRGIADDADRQGNDLTSFFGDVFREAIHRGLSHVIVDMPMTGGSLSIADERDLGIRPYFVHLSPRNVLGWATRVGPNGADELVQLRILEEVTRPDGLYGEKQINRIRVWNAPIGGGPGTVELWEAEKAHVQVDVVTHSLTDTDSYVLIDVVSHSYPGIPLRTLYMKRTGVMIGEPVLKALGWLNLEHYQSLSQHRHILQFARHGILFGKGFSESELEGLVIAASHLVKSTNQDAALEYVEHRGEAIAAGERDLERIESRMEVLGLQPMMERTGGQTATARAMDEAKTANNLQSWARLAENMIRELYDVAATWVNAEVPDDFGVDVFNDFGVSLRGSEEIAELLKARLAGELTQQTYLAELKRRGVLAETVDVEAEAEEAANDVPLGMVAATAMADATGEADPVDDDEDDDQDDDA